MTHTTVNPSIGYARASFIQARRRATSRRLQCAAEASLKLRP